MNQYFSSHQYIPDNRQKKCSLAGFETIVKIVFVPMQESGVCEGIQAEHGS